MKKNTNFLKLNSGHRIHYYYEQPVKNLPTIIFLHGYKSDINTTKAEFLQTFCMNKGFGCLMMEYRGHGASSGILADCSLTDWLDDVTITINTLIGDNPKILVGSSLGGWLSFLYVLNLNNTTQVNSIKGIVGIAPALDFTTDLTTSNYTINEDIDNNNILIFTNALETIEISKTFLNNIESHLLLSSATIAVNCPVRILHGLQDVLVLPSKSLQIIEKLTTLDAEVHFFKNGDHSLSQSEHLNFLGNTITELALKSVANK